MVKKRYMYTKVNVYSFHVTTKSPCTKKSHNGERYCGIFLMFTRNFLRDMYNKLGYNTAPAQIKKMDNAVMILPETVELESLFASMSPYLNPDVKPKDEFISPKLQEGLMALFLLSMKVLRPLMFDFSKPWKMDILDFMEENYTSDLSIEEIAHYTGRSLCNI